MIHQLRIYEIFEDTKSAFHDRFRDHAARLMRQHGFDIRAMWEARTDTRTEFVYLLAWPDEEWSRIKRETGAAGGPLVGEIEDRVLVPVAYSPAMSTSRSGRAS
jgi:hypothetical protein